MLFRGEYAFLSNMYKCFVMYEDHLFRASEIAYVYAKCADPEQRHQVTLLEDPYEAKKFGSTVLLKEGWDDIRVRVMYDIVKEKFKQNSNLRKRLLIVEGEIVEENWWNDTFWGTCRGIGENHLGNILMHLRDQFRRGDI